jgi:shikimate kinase
VLAGFTGAGKTTVGRLLATSLGVPFLDSDHVIEARAGRSIPEIFAADGEPVFRALQHEVIADLLRGPDVVLALGGGAAQDEETGRLLASVPVVFLRVSQADALERRQAVFAQAAKVTVDVDGRDPADIAQEILALLP